MSAVTLETVFLVAALLALAAHVSSEPLMRKGRARSLETGAFDRHTSILVTSTAGLLLVGSVAARFFVSMGRIPAIPGFGVPLLLIMLFGTALRFWSMGVLGECFTRTLVVVPGQRLVSRGPYRWIRHPGYLAHIVTLSACSAILAESWLVPLAAVLALFAAYRRRIRAEEDMLIHALGDAYREYQARSWRLLPGVY